MTIYINPDNNGFNEAVNKKIYVDKSNLIKEIYNISMNESKFICVSRPRQFGKSTDANMLIAYFSKGCDSTELFNNLNISRWSEYHKHLNKHNIISMNIQQFYNIAKNTKDMISLITKAILRDADKIYPSIDYLNKNKLSLSLYDIYNQTQEKFIFIIDSWDYILRSSKSCNQNMNDYLTFLNTLFKEMNYVEMVYMTGILPIKKYGYESAINMFKEISMIDSVPIGEFMGFTDKEVKDLCKKIILIIMK